MNFLKNPRVFLIIFIFLILNACYTREPVVDYVIVEPEPTVTLSPVTPGKYPSTCIQQNISMVKFSEGNVLDLFELCNREIQLSLPEEFSTLDENDLFLLFSNIVSYNLAPYGHSNALEMTDLICAPQLDCDNYIAAVGRFWEQWDSKIDISVHFVGWQGGAFGNHSQIFTRNKESGSKLMLDPTVALVVLASFDDVASGKPIPPEHILDFSHRNDQLGFKIRVFDALLLGKTRPSDLLYYYENLDHFLGNAEYTDNYLTPGGVRLRHKYHPEYFSDSP